MKKFQSALPALAASIVLTALAAGIAAAVQKNGGMKQSAAKLRKHPMVTKTADAFADLKSRFADNDDSTPAKAA